MIFQTLVLAITLVCSEPPGDSLAELLPGLFVGDGVVEFAGTVAIDCHHPDTPDVYLEMFVTAPDSREHESLVVSSIKPFALHAALLAAGFEPGSPLSKNPETQETIPAHGDHLEISIQFPDTNDNDTNPFLPIEQLVVTHTRNKSLIDSKQWESFVFAGSVLAGSTYTADQAGTLISLTSFGDEVIAPSWTVSHLAEVDEPVWIANNELLPKQGTDVRIRIQKLPENDDSKDESESVSNNTTDDSNNKDISTE